MRALLLTLAVLGALMAASASAQSNEQVIAGLSQNQISITTDFDGSELFIYGAIKRFAPPPPGDLDVVIVVVGPSRPVVIRKKVRRFGIWLNGPGVEVDRAPSFYAISTSRPFRDVVSHTDDQRYRIGLDYAVQLIGETDDETYPEDFRRAAIRLNRAKGLYFEQTGGVTIEQETLFQTRVGLPAQLVEGDYLARIFLVRDNRVVDLHERVIGVRKVGLERWIYTMAQEQAALYGILSIAVALLAGWLASAFFRYFFP